MNIGITCFPTYGGSGVVGSELGRELSDRGHSVHFISSALPTRLVELHDKLQFHQVEMYDYPLFSFPPYTLALASKILQIAKAMHLDVLHMHYAIPHATAAYLAREMFRTTRYLPIVTTLHGTDITLVGAHSSFLPITRFSIAQSDAVTAISQYLAKQTNEIFGQCSVEVIPNFINAKQNFRCENKELRSCLAPNGELLIMHVSNFRPVKRVTDCILVAAKLKHQIPNRLILCGEGPDREKAKNVVLECGLTDHDVLFAGQVPNINDYLSVADLLLVPSENESFGLVALEAMACEVPVIATREGGLPEVIEDGKTGYLVPVGDIETMKERALDVLSNRELRRKMGLRGRTLALDHFNTDRIIPQYVSLYERILNESPK